MAENKYRMDRKVNGLDLQYRFKPNPDGIQKHYLTIADQKDKLCLIMDKDNIRNYTAVC